MIILRICGFPRSGNTFSFYSMQSAFQNNNYIIKRSHNITDLDKNNVFTPIRNPLDAAAALSVFGNKDFHPQNLSVDLHDVFGLDINNIAESSIVLYLEFYEKVLKRINNIYIAKFEDIVNDINQEFSAYSTKFNLSKNKNILISDEYQHKTRKNYDHIKNEILNNKLFIDALSVYDEIISIPKDLI